MKLIIQSLENLRYVSFWVIDFLKGSKIKKHIEEIKFILENEDAIKSKSYCENYLTALLNHAITTTNYYKRIKLENGLSAFPVINKNIINNNLSSFQSTSYSQLKNKTVKTSGSTGTAFTVLQNKNKVYRNTADTIYFSRKAGYKLGNKILYVRHWNTYYKKSNILTWLQNITPIEVLDLNDRYISKLINKLEKDDSTKGWFGYASAFKQICEYLDKTGGHPPNVKIESIIAIAEGLSDYTKKSMQRYFKAPCISRYSNMENGIIAQQNIQNNNFTINWASYYVEILNFNDDTPVENGIHGRIVITDLFNYCNPLIRYDTGDVGAMDTNQSPPVLKDIEGRKMDIIYNTKGEMVSSFIIIDLIHFTGIRQSQLIQTDEKKYIIKLNVSKEFKEEDHLISDLKKNLGNDAEISISYVNEIPPLASGKTKTTVNTYLNNI